MNVFWGGVKKSFLFHQKIANVDQGGRNLINLLTVYFVLPLRRRLRLYFFQWELLFYIKRTRAASDPQEVISVTILGTMVLFRLLSCVWQYVACFSFYFILGETDQNALIVSKLHTNFLVGNHHRTIVNNLMDSVSRILDPFYWSMQQKNLAGW